MRARYGKREGFSNPTKKRCHDVGTAMARKTPICIHENVEGFEEARYPFVIYTRKLSSEQ